jgi:hypothetical protein
MDAYDRPNGEMTDKRPAQGAAHASHDLFAIAAAADRDADTIARAAADAQMAGCAECTALFADLQAISTGLAGLPRELPVGRDFRLSPDRAASLRRRSWRTALDGLFRSPSLRPFGNALATLGFAGLLFTVVLPNVNLGLGSAGSAPAILSTVGSSVPAYPVSGAGGGAPGTTDQSAPEVSGGGKTGATAPTDKGGGAVPGAQASPAAAYQASGAPDGSGSELSAAGQSAEPGRDAAGQGAAGGPLAPAGPDLLSLLPWLSVGSFLVGIGLLLMARIGGRARAG